MKISIRTIFAAAIAAASLATTAFADGNKAYTWVVKNQGGSGAGTWAVVGADSASEAYVGDTLPTETLPILCIIDRNQLLVEPPTYQASFGTYDPFYHAWSGKHIGLSQPVLISSISGQAQGDNKCKQDLGHVKARMATHHDNGVGGWHLGGRVFTQGTGPSLLQNAGQQRFIVRIGDQTANPWNS